MLMEIVLIIVAFVVGALLAYLFTQNKFKGVQSDLLLAQQQTQTERQAKDELQGRLQAAADEAGQLRSQLSDVKAQLSAVQAQLDTERAHNASETKLRQEQVDREMALRQQQFHEQLRTVQEQFSTLATKVLDQTADKLKTTNNEEMQHITQPLRDNIDKLHDAIEKTNQETAKSTASLSQQLNAMAEQTQKIDTTATRLTNVMRGSNKLQGNWGELFLQEILEQNGFKEGVNYDVQQTLTDEQGRALTNDNGRRMIPDVILHYPKNEDVIIDSKMSIEAYYEYVNADNEMLRKKFADDLVKSIRTQYMGLSRKDYSSYVKPPRHAIDFVIMFVPNEGALQLALATDKKLWNDAFEHRVFITSQQNLMAILKMIQLAWRQYVQTENQLRVYGLAEELLKRVNEFVKRFTKLRKDIDTLSKDYDDVSNKAYTGKQSIAQKANELVRLGVKDGAISPLTDTSASPLPQE